MGTAGPAAVHPCSTGIPRRAILGDLSEEPGVPIRHGAKAEEPRAENKVGLCPRVVDDADIDISVIAKNGVFSKNYRRLTVQNSRRLNIMGSYSVSRTPDAMKRKTLS